MAETRRRVRMAAWRQDLLERIGVAVEHVPAYVHPKPGSPHGHDFLEMNFIVDGETEHALGDGVYRERPGSLGIIHYGIAHEIVTPTGPVEIINLYADPRAHPLPALPASMRAAMGALLPLHANLQHRRNQVRHLQFADKAPVEAILRAMLREQGTAAVGYEHALHGLFGLLLLHCCRRWAEDRAARAPSATGDPGEEARLEGLRLHLEEAYRASVRLDELAARMGMSRGHLCRRFKAYTGMTLTAYVLARRVREAMLLLRTTDRKVLAIALDCGFQDISFFNRKFKAIAGVTPRHYRERLAGPRAEA